MASASVAHHPMTGKEIQILQTSATTWKSKKTLAWLPHQNTPFDTIHTEGQPTIRILLNPVELSELKQISHQHKIIFVSKEVLKNIRATEIKEAGISNLIVLEEMCGAAGQEQSQGLYAHLGEPWNGTEDHAAILAAALFKYRVLAKASPLSIENRDIAQKLHVQISSNTTAQRVWWVTQFYTPSKAKRRREIETCLSRNCASKYIDKVVLLNEKKEELPKGLSRQPEERIIGQRLTYKAVLEAALTFPDDVILVFANADICIDDDTWRSLWTIDMKNKCLALLRWDIPASGKQEEATLFGPRADSQDTWIIQVADLKARGPSILSGMEIPFGQAGCDNAVAMEFLKNHFTVINPAYSLRTWHYHSSGVRGYDAMNIVDRPRFLYIHPTGLHDMEPIMKQMGAAPYRLIQPATLFRQFKGSKASAAATGSSLKLGTNNPFSPFAESVLRLIDCFQTDHGLMFDREKMYIGQVEKAQRLWQERGISSLAPTLGCKRGLIVPFEAEDMKVREKYMIFYLSRILGLWEEMKGEFFGRKEFSDLLDQFQWGVGRVPLLTWEPDVNIWCEEALGTLVREERLVRKEDIEALRKWCKRWVAVAEAGSKPKLIIFSRPSGDSWTDYIEAKFDSVFDIKVVYQGRTSVDRMMESLSGAWGVVLEGNSVESWGWNWVLPPGAFVFHMGFGSGASAGASETSSSMEEVLTMSAACGLEHRFTHSNQILEDIEKEFTIYTSATGTTGPAESVSEDTTLPILWLPRANLEGYFSHAGDSFREMARLWGERGFCRVKEHPTSVMCWWGAVGEKGVLLYDRPNHDWRLAAPTAEKSWFWALFGNPKPAAGRPGESWFFWPRRPALVEEMVGAHVLKEWSERRAGAAFIGKIENKVQEKRRMESWAEACAGPDGLWSLVKGAAEPYPFTQTQYLKELAGSRWGLCLAGYGLKCHREVECMAMGCVPLVAPEVDMDGYAQPPVEGTHYFRVQSVADVQRIVKETSQAKWEEMSKAGQAWWQENCSVEGSFALTKRLIDKAQAQHAQQAQKATK